jgi:hypothetical protein
MAKRKAQIIKHLHLYSPPLPAPKITRFTKIFTTVKAWFSNQKRDKMCRRGKAESRRSVAPVDESHWPSDTEESVFASEIGDEIEDLA